MERYKVTVEEDNGGFEIVALLIGVCLIGVIIYVAIWVGIPILLIWLIYKFVKWRKKKKAQNKIAKAERRFYCKSKRGY